MSSGYKCYGGKWAGISDGLKCYFIKDDYGDVAGFQQRSKGSKGINYAEIFGKEYHRRRKQPVERPCG